MHMTKEKKHKSVLFIINFFFVFYMKKVKSNEYHEIYVTQNKNIQLCIKGICIEYMHFKCAGI